MSLNVLAAAHAMFATFGFVGLIATNLALLLFCRQPGASVSTAIRTWRASARIFGPLLGLGLILGIWLALAAGISLSATWLLVAYALIVVAAGTQTAIMVPFQLRATNAASAAPLSTRGIAGIVATFTVAYICIMLLMIARPL